MRCYTIIISSYYQAHFTAAFNLLLPLFHLIIIWDLDFVFSAVSVLTTQLSMSSLNIYHHFMYFRVSLPLVRFSRSPQPKLFKDFYFLFLFSLICWELPCCTSINFV